MSNKLYTTPENNNDLLTEIARLKEEKIRLLETMIRERAELPHLYLYKHYKWSRKFYDSLNKRNILCACNQVGKSSALIRRFIHRATTPEQWKMWYPKLVDAQVPTPFWYGYPSFPVATQEFMYKWKQFLPKGEMKNDPKYGWQEKMKNGYIEKICFNSGVDIVFKAYKQDAQDLQSGSVWEMGLDEEPPADLMSELMMRLNATKGYFNAVFTATQGQKFWKEIVEEKRRWHGEDGEEPAHIEQVSLYDSQYYEDGSVSPWDDKAIKHAISLCSSEAEVQRRVFGRFIVDEGLKYQSFIESRNTTKTKPDMSQYPIVYAGVDYGSGGKAHPSAITFVGVDAEYTRAVVFKCWRSPPGVDITNEDVVKKYLEMARGFNVVVAWYDWAAKDLATIAGRLGLTFQKAEKGHDIGEATLNTLFKTGAVTIYVGEDNPDGVLLVEELQSLLIGTNKNNASDDLIDAFRYGTSSVPWNWEVITGLLEPEKARQYSKYELARPGSIRADQPKSDSVIEEMDYWDSLMV